MHSLRLCYSLLPSVRPSIRSSVSSRQSRITFDSVAAAEIWIDRLARRRDDRRCCSLAAAAAATVSVYYKRITSSINCRTRRVRQGTWNNGDSEWSAHEGDSVVVRIIEPVLDRASPIVWGKVVRVNQQIICIASSTSPRQTQRTYIAYGSSENAIAAATGIIIMKEKGRTKERNEAREFTL